MNELKKYQREKHEVSTYPGPINVSHVIQYPTASLLDYTGLLRVNKGEEYVLRKRTGKGGLKASRSLWRTPMLTDRIT